jgi:tetratricopeptide (TPR) repeat protein
VARRRGNVVGDRAKPDHDVQRDFREALARLNAGDLDGAGKACEALRRIAPDDAAVLQLHATVALRAGKPADALGSIRRSLVLRPGHVPSLLIAARAARGAGVAQQALAPLREALARAPDHAEAAFLLCQTLLDLGDPSLDRAVEQAAARHPDNAPAWQQMGLAFQRAQRPEAALAAFTRASEADPMLADAHFGRGLALRDVGRMEDARLALQRATELEPAAAGAWFALGLTCQDLLDEAAAASAFQAALDARPGFAEAAVNLGICLQRLGDMDAAIEAFRRAIRIRPDTLGRIAQAVTAARTGMLWLDPAAFRRALGA